MESDDEIFVPDMRREVVMNKILLLLNLNYRSLDFSEIYKHVTQGWEGNMYMDEVIRVIDLLEFKGLITDSSKEFLYDEMITTYRISPKGMEFCEAPIEYLRQRPFQYNRIKSRLSSILTTANVIALFAIIIPLLITIYFPDSKDKDNTTVKEIQHLQQELIIIRKELEVTKAKPSAVPITATKTIKK